MHVLFCLGILLIWTAMPLQASGAIFNDSFDRPDDTDLGPDWKETLPDLEIAGQAVRNATGNDHPRAAIFRRPIGPDQDVSVLCKVTAPNNACGVVARYSDANNFYRARLDVGRQDIVLAKTVQGETTVLEKAPRAMKYDTYYPIRLVVEGSAVRVFFGGEETPIIAVEDTSLAVGNFAGIRGQASAPGTNFFDNFALLSPEALPSAQHGADLVLGLLTEADQVVLGETFTYTAVVLNGGPDPATAVTLTNTLPQGLALTSAPENCHGSNPVICDLGTLKVNESGLVTLTAATNSTGIMTLVAGVRGGVDDPDPASNSVSLSTMVDADPFDSAGRAGGEGGGGNAPPPPAGNNPGGAPVDPPGGGSSGHGGCVLSPEAAVDPTLIAVLVGAVASLILKRPPKINFSRGDRRL